MVDIWPDAKAVGKLEKRRKDKEENQCTATWHIKNHSG